MCPLFPASSAKAPATREGKARKGRREPDLLSFRIRLFETNFLGPQGCLNKKHTCGEPTAGVAHTFPGGIQGPGRGVTAHQRAPPEKATGPARLAHPGFGLEHPGNGPKTGKSLNFTYCLRDKSGVGVGVGLNGRSAGNSVYLPALRPQYDSDLN